MTDKKRICPDCGREWSEKVIFCMGCGARTVEKTEALYVETKENIQIEKPLAVVDKVESSETSDKLPDIEELILAYIRKVLKDEKETSDFINQIRKLVDVSSR